MRWFLDTEFAEDGRAAFACAANAVEAVSVLASSCVAEKSDWERIRDRFTQGERDQLNAANVGQLICPRGGIVDLAKLPEELRAKLERELGSLEEARPAGTRRNRHG